jgi:hypothetical protein
LIIGYTSGRWNIVTEFDPPLLASRYFGVTPNVVDLRRKRALVFKY